MLALGGGEGANRKKKCDWCDSFIKTIIIEYSVSVLRCWSLPISSPRCLICPYNVLKILFEDLKTLLPTPTLNRVFQH